jgi:hypothetical protein
MKGMADTVVPMKPCAALSVAINLKREYHAFSLVCMTFIYILSVHCTCA